uniref:Uncharacterized protein n=1 Tax=Bracon brevicornis TaxID=1563983 RepID=A0A6V7KCB3_9HYME
MDRIYYMMTDERDKDAVTLEAMLTALGRQIQVSGCILRGSMTPEGDIFVMIQTTSTKASDLQTRACVAEMEKIVIRITEKSPKVMAEVPLGALTGAEIIDEPISSAASQKYSFIFLFFPVLIIGVVT